MRKTLLLILVLLVLGAGYLVFKKINPLASEPKVYKIGILVRGGTYRPAVDGFRSKMKDLGYEEGKNITYLVRFVDKKEDLAPTVSEFLKEKVDLIHTYSTPATVETYKQTKIIPIVFGSMGDPLASGLVHSLQKPDTNVTGVQSLSSPLAAKRLELLKEAVPSLHRAAFPFTPEDVAGKSSYNSALEAAGKLGVTLVPYYITKERDAATTALAIKRKDVDGIVISSDSAVWAVLASYVAQAKKERLPFAVFDKDMVENGGLLGYGPDYFTNGEQAAVYADKIFNGANPATLPVDSPRRFLLALNLKTAREIGITFSQDFLAKADLVIDK